METFGVFKAYGHARKTAPTISLGAKCRAFAAMLSELAGVPVELYDERLTTVSAHNILSELNVRGKKRKDNVDELSATLILQDYIDRNMK